MPQSRFDTSRDASSFFLKEEAAVALWGQCPPMMFPWNGFSSKHQLEKVSNALPVLYIRSDFALCIHSDPVSITSSELN